ncbi:MAG: hypothetical protein WA152_00590 [Microgenomates group bacterium]
MIEKVILSTKPGPNGGIVVVIDSPKPAPKPEPKPAPKPKDQKPS